MSVAYSDITTALGTLFEIPISTPGGASPSSDTNFNNILPRAIEQAEQRIYRELDLITTTTAQTATLSSGVRNVAIPGGIIIVYDLNIITPAATAPDAGTRNPVQRVSLSFLNAAAPTAAAMQGSP